MMCVLMLDVEGGKESLWDDIVRLCSEKEGEVEPLYATRCVTHGDISLIMDVKDPDQISDFVSDTLAPLGGLRDLWMFNMINPRFFPIPLMTTSQELKPFTITIDGETEHYRAMFEAISNIQPTNDVIVTYLAYTFQSFEDDLVLSLLGKDIYTVDDFVINNIRQIDGIFDSKTYAISKTKILTSFKNWRNYINKYSYTRKEIVSEDAEEDDLNAYAIAF